MESHRVGGCPSPCGLRADVEGLTQSSRGEKLALGRKSCFLPLPGNSDTSKPFLAVSAVIPFAFFLTA